MHIPATVRNALATDGTPGLSPDRLAFTPAEFAALFGKSPTWGYRQLYAGNVKRLANSDSLLVPRSEIERFISNVTAHE